MNLTGLNGWAAGWGPCMLRACGHGALALAGVWAICRLFPRLPPSLRAALWWLACLKTLLSLAVTGPLPLVVLPADAPPAFAPSRPAPAFAPSRPAPAFAPSRPAAAREPAVITAADRVPPAGSERPGPGLSSAGVVLCLWIAGVFFLLAALCREFRAVRRLAEQADPCDDAPALQEVARAVGLTRLPPVLVSERVECSLVVGPWRPAVLLSRADRERLSPAELRALLAHELAHIRRRDLWIGILPNLVRLLFFFNPLVWLACREYDLARESACDAEALRVSGLTSADYGRLLLKLSAAPPRSSMAALGAASPYGTLRRRLRGLQRLGNGSAARPRGISALALLAAVGVLSLNPVRVGAGPVPHALSAPPRSRAGDPVRVADATAPARPALSPAKTAILNVHRKKEDQSMLKLPRGSRLKRSAALAGVALVAAGIPTVFTAPLAAQEAPAKPFPPSAPDAPAAPAAPAAPVAPLPVQASRYQYTLRSGDSYTVRAHEKTVASGQRELAKAQPGDCLVVDRDGRRYLITDAATLRRIRENDAPVEALGKQMEAMGKQMEGASKPMEELGKQMEGLGKQMEAIGRQMEEQGELLATAVEEGKPEADRAAIQERMRSLQQQMRAPQEEMRGLAQKMREQSAKMRLPHDQLRELGRQMRAAVKEAEERLVSLLDAAFANNLAVEQKAP